MLEDFFCGFKVGVGYRYLRENNVFYVVKEYSKGINIFIINVVIL